MSKKFPKDEYAERLVLGAALNDPVSCDEVADRLESSDFDLSEHVIIAHHIRSFKGPGSLDVHRLAESLKRSDEMEKAGGLSYLVSISMEATPSTDIEYYVSKVKQCALARRFILEGYQCAKEGHGDPEHIQETVEAAIDRMSRLSQGGHRDYLSIREASEGSGEEKSYEEELQERQELWEERGIEGVMSTHGIGSGLPSLDSLTGGWGNSHLIVVAGRTSMGKTAFMLHCAADAIAQGHPVAFFSLEMSNRQIISRLLSRNAQVASDVLGCGSWDQEQKERIDKELERLKEENLLYLDDTPSLSINLLRSRARLAHRRHGLRLIVVDYLQLIQTPDNRREQRHLQVAEICRALKQIARELNIPVIVGAQLNREVDHRPDKKPMLSDLRESGSIEQDSDQVIMMHRRDYYDPQDKPGILDIYVAKNRHGATGRVFFLFEKSTGLIQERTPLRQ